MGSELAGFLGDVLSHFQRTVIIHLDRILGLAVKCCEDSTHCLLISGVVTEKAGVWLLLRFLLEAVRISHGLRHSEVSLLGPIRSTSRLRS